MEPNYFKINLLYHWLCNLRTYSHSTRIRYFRPLRLNFELMCTCIKTHYFILFVLSSSIMDVIVRHLTQFHKTRLPQYLTLLTGMTHQAQHHKSIHHPLGMTVKMLQVKRMIKAKVTQIIRDFWKFQWPAKSTRFCLILPNSSKICLIRQNLAKIGRICQYWVATSISKRLYCTGKLLNVLADLQGATVMNPLQNSGFFHCNGLIFRKATMLATGALYGKSWNIFIFVSWKSAEYKVQNFYGSMKEKCGIYQYINRTTNLLNPLIWYIFFFQHPFFWVLL